MDHLHSETQSKPLPWWTWLMPIVLLYAGSQISAFFKYAPGAAFYYMPTTIGIILMNWWGPKRVVPAMYVNAFISAHLWDVGPWYLWPIYAIPETIFVFGSWYFFTRKGGKYWLPNINSLVTFLLAGILGPLMVEIFLLEVIYIAAGERPLGHLFFTFIRSSLGEFISNFGLTLPILHYLTWPMKKKGWLLHSTEMLSKPYLPNKKNWIEIIIVYSILLFLSFLIPFSQYWFVYGIFSLYMAIRYGFGLAVVTNLYIFLLTYLLPLIANQFFHRPQTIEENVINIYLGTSLLYVFSAITGRVIGDLNMVKERIVEQLYSLEVANKELEITNQELDKFVYSVSHDLSAPLKSILGLVTISRLNPKQEEHQSYFDKIESSVKKLEDFIHEILDYSRNKRQALVVESVNLRVLCTEIIENLQFIEGFDRVTIDMENLNAQLSTDKARLKIILNNLLTNAVKYQKQLANHIPHIRLYSETQPDSVLLHVEDNGEGIPPDLQKKVFQMFFRGSQKSKGSGLGLYIAQEAAAKIHGNISLVSVYGEGSVFTIKLANLSR